MKFVYPDIDYTFDTDIGFVNTIVIENQPLFLALVTDLKNQLAGFEGKAVLSSDKILPLSKNTEVLDSFVPFDLSTKSLVTKITSDLERKALSEDYVVQSTSIVGTMDAFLSNISFDYPCSIKFGKVSIGSFIKAAGIEIVDDYDNLCEKLLDYFQLVNEFLGEKLFVTINLRSYISDKDSEMFMESVLLHNFNVIMIENYEHPFNNKEKRLIIDTDLCLIG